MEGEAVAVQLDVSDKDGVGEPVAETDALTVAVVEVEGVLLSEASRDREVELVGSDDFVTDGDGVADGVPSGDGELEVDVETLADWDPEFVSDSELDAEAVADCVLEPDSDVEAVTVTAAEWDVVAEDEADSDGDEV